jgi:hypothetical protein
MSERRYRDEEVRRIFKLATTDKVANAPDVVARAAAALDAGAPTSARKSLGMPVEVGTIVPLPRALTDREWEILVGEVRRVFRARGQVHSVGNSREWRNGNLHVVVEPAQTGYRLRLGTLKGDAAGINALGATGVIASLVTWGVHFVSNDPNVLVAPVLFAAGVTAFAANRLRLPAWASMRETQFQEIVAKVRSMIESLE